MIIAGVQKLSLVDYPGYLALAVFVQGCNFKCGYCQNPDLITAEDKFHFEEKGLFDLLALRKDKLEAVVVSGGEPTIHKDLPDFIKRIKDTGYKVKLDTNGANPAQLEELIRRNLLDYIAIDIKTSFAKYGMLTDIPDIDKLIYRSVKLAMLANVDYEFRVTCVPGVVSGEDIELIAREIKGAKNCFLQQFRPQETYDKKFRDIAPYTKEEIKGFGQVLGGYVHNVAYRGI